MSMALVRCRRQGLVKAPHLPSRSPRLGLPRGRGRRASHPPAILAQGHLGSRQLLRRGAGLHEGDGLAL
eukprot:2441-Pyramimonas_sp.AAC.1